MQYAEANIIFPIMQIPDNISANNNSNLNNILNFKPMFTEIVRRITLILILVLKSIYRVLKINAINIFNANFKYPIHKTHYFLTV